MKYYGVIYKLTSPKGKCYIGQTRKDPNKRWNNYKALCCRNQPKLFNALKKYGPENFVYEVIDHCDNQQNLDEKEKYYIQRLDAIKNGYNQQLGGYSQKFTPEICKKISATKKRRNKNRIHNWTGKHHTKETKKKLSLLHLGKKKGPHTEEWKKKMSERFKGEGNPFFGIPFFKNKKHTKETKKKIADKNAKTYQLINPDGVLFIVRNLKQFCLNNNLNNRAEKFNERSN